jgi:tRNA nucleotidyltransferase (CCA-adding enzyme)
MNLAEVTPEHIPEVMAIHGIPQVAEYHPEIDTLVHVRMVWEQAKKLAPNDPGIWLAALVSELAER